METTPTTSYPSPDRDIAVDVAVLGAGIAGLTTALLLERDGASVAVIEASRVAAGATGYTTAKVSAQHGVHYESVESSFGAGWLGLDEVATPERGDLAPSLTGQLAVASSA